MASLFSKPNTIVYVRRSGLLVAGRQIKPARLNFPNGVVGNLELLQPTKFIRGCQAFFEDHQLKGKRVLMVLDQSVVFDTVVELLPGQQATQVVAEFVPAIPYDAGKRSCLQRTVDTRVVLYATNYDFFMAISQSLEAAGISKLLAITPAAAYDLSGTDQKFGSAVAAYIADTTVHSQTNFNSVSPL